MGFCKTSAITLRRTDYSDSSQIITFYTREYGKIQALAKGLKRSVKGISGGIDLLTHNNIVFIQRERTNLNILSECTLQDNFYLLRDDLKKFYSAFHLLELVKEFTEENDKNGPLFDLFINTLSEIARKDDPAINTLAFKVQMLAILGFMPEMKHCVICKAELNTKRFAFFSALEGGLQCPSCKENNRGRIKISGGTIATINYLAANSDQKIERLMIQPSLRNETKKLLRYYISFLLSKELKMWRYL